MVTKVDAVTGAQTIISSGGNFVQPIGIAIVPAADGVKVEDLSPILQDIVENNPGTPLADKVGNAAASLQTAAEELDKTPPDGQAAVGNIEGAVGDVQAAVDDGLLDATQGSQIGYIRVSQLMKML